MKYFRHPTSVVESEEIGEGTRIWHFAHVREGAKIGSNCNIGKGVYVDAKVVIGNNVKIQNFATIYRGVVIEDSVFVGPAVVFTNDLYPRAHAWSEERVVRTIVRRGASIGANSTIICGIEIGEYAMIGAGSVVTRNVPPHALVYGNPAKLRGFVCYCGRKLEKIAEEKDESIVYECSNCGEFVEVRREWSE